MSPPSKGVIEIRIECWKIPVKQRQAETMALLQQAVGAAEIYEQFNSTLLDSSGANVGYARKT